MHDRNRANPKLKITEDQLRELRNLYGSGVSPYALASRFGISRTHAARLAKGLSQAKSPAKVMTPEWKRSGFSNPRMLLTDAQVKEIRQLYGTRNYTQRVLADIFTVSQTQICNIVNGKARKKC